MSTIISLYDDILVPNNPDPDNPPTTGGTWSYVGTGSTGSAPLPPAPPGTYNGTIDFAGVANGSWPYKYEVTSGSCTHTSIATVTVGDHVPVVHDDCATAKVMAFPYNNSCYELFGETLVGSCPGPADPDFDSSITAPTAWGSGAFDADVWYQFTYNPASNPGGVAPINMAVSVKGSPYGSNGVTNPAIAIYSSCSSASLVHADISPNQDITIILSGIFASSFTYYVRVSAPDGSEGKFDIALTT